MKVAIAGASGLVGRALVAGLETQGHDVLRLVRRSSGAANEVRWDPAAGELEPAALHGVDAAINLAGENLGEGRWTRARRERILRSRIDATRTLVRALGALPTKPAVLMNASAVGIYGDRGDEILVETSGSGSGFLPEVCRAWENETAPAAAAGVRTVLLRFGIVLSGEGGALAKMMPLFRLGLGGPLGSGQQWMSWVSLDDVVEVVRQALSDERFSGPLNVVAPALVTNAEFTATLARVLRRPAVLRAPAWALRVALGRPMADEALLGSVRATPQRLTELGYEFRHGTLETALRAALGATRQL